MVSLREHIPLVTERPLVAVASHTHFDHIAGHHEFPERWVHRAEADVPGATRRRANTLADPYASDEAFEALPPLPYASTTYCPSAAPATRLLDDGDVVDLGDRALEVIHTPGHSPGGIALFERASGILFSGDIVYDGPLIEDCPGADAAALRPQHASPARPAGARHARWPLPELLGRAPARDHRRVAARA